MNRTKDKPETILIIDDIPANVTVMADYLAASGFQVLAARNGETGLRIARRERPNLILLDVLLPDINGFETCRRLKADEQTREIPVIFMTIVTKTEDKMKGFEVGGVDYITKPFQREEVLARVTTHLALYRLQHDLREMNRTLEDKVAERTAELTKANRAYRALSDCNQALLRATEKDDLLHDICRIIHQVCGYRLVWIGLAEQDDTNTVWPAAQAGDEEGYLETDMVTWANNEWGQGPTGAAIQTGQPVVNCDVLTNQVYRPWREEALQRGYCSSLVLPLKDENANTFGALTIYAAEPNAFTSDEMRLLEELAGDLAFGIVALRTRAERTRAEDELRASEARFRTLVEQAADAFFLHDNQGTILDVNRQACESLGYTREELIGMSPEVFDADIDRSFAEQLQTRLTDGEVVTFDTHHRRKDGAVFPVEVRISAFREGGRPVAFSLVRDITARKRTEEALRILNEELELRVSQRTAELEAANKELHEFAYIVSHDLKAPLRGISRLTQWLREDYAGMLGAQGQEQLDLLGDQVKRMNTMINGILRYSRAGYGGERKESIELNTLVAQVIKMLMPPAHITIQCENTLPVIHGDPIQLMQVFQNLLSNAVKFLDKPAGKIIVASEDADEMWIFRVEDNGPGIEPRHHDRIFKIFQSCTTRDDRENTGIGLAVVKKIVELYGGRVWVESTPGQGSRFSFTWPKRTSGED